MPRQVPGRLRRLMWALLGYQRLPRVRWLAPRRNHDLRNQKFALAQVPEQMPPQVLALMPPHWRQLPRLDGLAPHRNHNFWNQKFVLAQVTERMMPS